MLIEFMLKFMNELLDNTVNGAICNPLIIVCDIAQFTNSRFHYDEARETMETAFFQIPQTTNH